MKTVDIVITDTDYFAMLDNQIRDKWASFEVKHLLPIVESILDGMEIREYPIEGYYYKTEKLSRYFTLVRNLQENESLVGKVNANSEYFVGIKAILGNPLFGQWESEKNDFLGKKTLVRRRWDSLAKTLEFLNDGSAHPWSVEKVMENIGLFSTIGFSLVDLAALIKDPALLTCGAETNSLYRGAVYISGCAFIEERYIWGVSNEVEKLGSRIINEYNSIISDSRLKILPINVDSVNFLNRELELPRIAHLGYVQLTGENYYFRVDERGNFSDFYSKEVLTTQNHAPSSQKEFSTFI